jgi:hypothetical protein
VLGRSPIFFPVAEAVSGSNRPRPFVAGDGTPNGRQGSKLFYPGRFAESTGNPEAELLQLLGTRLASSPFVTEPASPMARYPALSRPLRDDCGLAGVTRTRPNWACNLHLAVSSSPVTDSAYRSGASLL